MEEKRGRGRPTEYRPEYAEEAYRLCLLNGATNDDLAEHFDVSKTTIKTWYKEHPEFLTSVKEGKSIADMKVANALYNRAIGAEWEEEQAFKLKKGRDEEVVEVVTVKRVAPPDTQAIQFWLKNRQPDKWREKIDLGLPAEIVVRMNLDGEAKPTEE